MRYKKQLLLLTLAITQTTAAYAIDCTKVQQLGESTRSDCVVSTDLGDKKIHLLQLKGTFAEIAYQQTYLMPNETESGLFKGISEKTEQEMNRSEERRVGKEGRS